MKWLKWLKPKETVISSPLRTREEMIRSQQELHRLVLQELRSQQIGYDPEQPMPSPRPVNHESIRANLGIPTMRYYIRSMEEEPQIIVRPLEPLVTRSKELNETDQMMNQGIERARRLTEAMND